MSNGLKRLVFRLLYLLGFPSLLRIRHKHALTVVLYHGVAPAMENGIYNYRGKFISPEAFARQIGYMKRHFHILPLGEAVERLQAGTLPPYPLAITFDDGYRNFYEHAFAILKREGVVATMFLATDFVCRRVPLWVDRLEYAVGKDEGSRADKIATDAKERDRLKSLAPDRREHDLRNIEQIGWTKFEDFEEDRAPYAPLSASEIAELADAGMTFGAHTVSHPILATQSPQQQKEEVAGSKRDVESLGIACSPVFAYPNGQPGDWTDATERTLQESGFTHALTTIEGVNDAATNPYQLRRLVLDNSDDMAVFANIVSGVRLFVKSIL